MYPERNALAERISLRINTMKLNVVPEPHDYDRKTAGLVKTHYPRINLDQLNHDLNMMLLGDTDAITAHVYEAINRVSLSKTPGFPLRAQFANNEQALTAAHVAIVRTVVARLYKLATMDCSDMTPQQMVERGLADPVAVSIKQEPNPERKTEDGNYRTVCQVSLVDQTVTRVMSHTQNDLEIKLWRTIPSKPGIGFSDDDSDHILAPVLKCLRNGTLMVSDIKGWDTAVQEWELLGAADSRADTSTGRGTLYHKIMRNMAYVLSRCVYVLSDGTLLAQTIYGGQVSGGYNTSSDNSKIRVKGAWWVGASVVQAMGDDANEDFVENAVERYAALGKTLREYAPCNGTLEFCSQVIKPGKIYPIDSSKSLYRLLNSTCQDKDQILRQYLEDNRHSPTRLSDITTIYESGWAASGPTL
jgi:hypothetical protein